jgi:hypothetical protein
MLGVKVAMSTAYHHQTNGQVERVNRMIEEILWHYVSQRHDDWDECLPMVEFAYNSSIHATTKKTPFEVVFGCNWQVNIVGILANRTEAADYLGRMKQNIDDARKAIELAQAPAKQAYDEHRRDVEFQVGQLVLLSSKHYLNENEQTRPTCKLWAEFMGPYKVMAIEGLDVRLKIPEKMKINPVVHIENVKVYNVDKRPGRSQPKPPKLVINGEDEYEVKAILDHKMWQRVPCSLERVFTAWGELGTRRKVRRQLQPSGRLKSASRSCTP